MSNFFQVGKKIVAVGRNYANHAKELNNAVPTTPFFFLKPTSAYIKQGQTIEIPPGVECHHEVELGVVIGKNARDLTEDQAHEHIAGYVLALDLTARNLQNEAKTKGLPWTQAKGYDTFCPVSSFIPKSEVADPNNLNLILSVDGKVKQNGSTSLMIFKIPQLISYISGIMTLEEGDVILTGFENSKSFG
eukprot:TRINITY_DN2324_c0_g1_i5.p1 TRINITY_DN2324_c0_g1~~TRINITY_DN2324_c0_g1_i5.p1  ORF type:complete len:190 (-),score=58.75 TRINITY_DN2324_c0_g1_i5:55-624(-)